MAGKILTESLHEGQVVRLTLNAPKANVLDSEMMTELQSELDSLAGQSQVKLIQFTGTGDHFCFGASVAEHTKENAPRMLKQFHQLFYTLVTIAKPTMAIVSGQCLGGGMELALMCNFIFADSTSRFGQPEIALGVFAPPASLLLPMKVGQATADALLLTGRSIKGPEAHTCGIVNELFETRQSMDEAVTAWVTKHILPKSASSLAYAVRAARWQFNRTLGKRLEALERFYVDELMNTHDANEGINSFLEKRSPEWTDK